MVSYPVAMPGGHAFPVKGAVAWNLSAMEGKGRVKTAGQRGWRERANTTGSHHATEFVDVASRLAC